MFGFSGDFRSQSLQVSLESEISFELISLIVSIMGGFIEQVSIEVGFTKLANLG